TGEFFSLTGDEYPGIIQTAVDTCRGKVPIIAGAGGPTRFAIQCAQAAEKAGAHGVLLLPHYLTEDRQQRGGSSRARVPRPPSRSSARRRPRRPARTACCCCRTTSPKPARKAWRRM